MQNSPNRKSCQQDASLPERREKKKCGEKRREESGMIRAKNDSKS